MDKSNVFHGLNEPRFLVESIRIFVRYSQILVGLIKCLSDCKVGYLKFVKNGQQWISHSMKNDGLTKLYWFLYTHRKFNLIQIILVFKSQKVFPTNNFL